jgi:hypothetical protein
VIPVLVLAAIAAPDDLAAPPTTQTSTAPDPLQYAKWALFIDGQYTWVTIGAWGLSSRAYDAPYPNGLLGVAAARVMNGTSWTVLITAEVALLRWLSGEHWEGLSHGTLMDNWLIGFDVPGRCRSGRAAPGSCGLGLGAYGETGVTIERGDVPIRAVMSAGWIEGRFDDTPARTLIEHTWVQAPVSLRPEVPIALGPFDLRLILGPGVYWGLHTAHVHPHPAFQDELNIPWHEITVLHGGVGFGLYGRVELGFMGAISIHADADLAVLPLGGSNTGAPPVVLVLDPFRDRGPVLWRRFATGVGLSPSFLSPLKLAIRYWTGELSPGPLTKLGHQCLGLEFEVPMELNRRDVEDRE